jgi:hypothetical protein
MSAREQPATAPPADLVKQVAGEMGRCRQRGLEGIDKHTRNQSPVQAPQLERLARQYCQTKGLDLHGRIAPISRLLRDGLDAYIARGCDSEGTFLTELFFGDQTTGARATNAGQLLDAALVRRGHSEQWFTSRRRTLFEGFAVFLVTFVTETPSTAIPDNPDTAPDTAPVTAPDPGPASRMRPAAARTAIKAVIAALLVTGAGGAVVWLTAHEGKSNPAPTHHHAAPHRTIGLPADAGKTYTETVSSGTGARTFTDPYSVDESGPNIPFLKPVQVPCKIYSPVMSSIGPQAYWYRIASPPWNNHYYAPADSFANGDPPQGPYTGKDIDPAVPDCPIS